MLRVNSSNSSLYGALQHVRGFIHLELITGKEFLACTCGLSAALSNGCISVSLLIAKALPHLQGLGWKMHVARSSQGKRRREGHCAPETARQRALSSTSSVRICKCTRVSGFVMNALYEAHMCTEGFPNVGHASWGR